jgi:hypothetical protein
MKNTSDVLKEKSMNDCMMDIMPFLVWSADTDEIVGGVHAVDALDSFRQLLGYDVETFEKLCDIFRIEDDETDYE